MSAASVARDTQAWSPLPTARELRLVGPGAPHARGRTAAPLGATFTGDALARAVALGPGDAVDVDSVARALPSADELPSGTLVVVLPQIVDPPSLASRLLAALGRGRTVSRALRASALVAQGYVRVAAGIDKETRADLVWGYSPEDPVARVLTDRAS
jgi:hypothetical protein